MDSLFLCKWFYLQFLWLFFEGSCDYVSFTWKGATRAFKSTHLDYCITKLQCFLPVQNETASFKKQKNNEDRAPNPSLLLLAYWSNLREFRVYFRGQDRITFMCRPLTSLRQCCSLCLSNEHETVSVIIYGLATCSHSCYTLHMYYLCDRAS